MAGDSWMLKYFLTPTLTNDYIAVHNALVKEQSCSITNSYSLFSYKYTPTNYKPPGFLIDNNVCIYIRIYMGGSEPGLAGYLDRS